MKPTTLYHRNARGQVSVWSIWLSGYTVFRKWGIVGGKMQTTTESFPSKRGKDSLTVAHEAIARQVKKKRDEGFNQDVTKTRLTHKLASADLDFTTLPKSFAPQKPIQECPTIVDARDFIIQRKRDGQRHFALWDVTGRVRLYSRKMHDMTYHMPLVVRELQDLDLPPRTILDGEIICDRNGKDDFRATNEVCRAGVSVAVFNERKLPIKYMIFDVLYVKGKDYWSSPYWQRFDWLMENIVEGVRITLPETVTLFDTGRRYVKARDWEGLVLWNKNACNILRMDGKPQRAGCYKWKPVANGDFVAIGWLPGKGRLAKTMGKLRIAEWHNGPAPDLVEICNVGTGFDNATRDEAMTWKYPCVVELAYAFQQLDTRALREPVFLRTRPDKTVKKLR
jgi:bifunctional non-homologous end joining protein LigD